MPMRPQRPASARCGPWPNVPRKWPAPVCGPLFWWQQVSSGSGGRPAMPTQTAKRHSGSKVPWWRYVLKLLRHLPPAVRFSLCGFEAGVCFGQPWNTCSIGEQAILPDALGEPGGGRINVRIRTGRPARRRSQADGRWRIESGSRSTAAGSGRTDADQREEHRQAFVRHRLIRLVADGPADFASTAVERYPRLVQRVVAGPATTSLPSWAAELTAPNVVGFMLSGRRRPCWRGCQN